jgi:cysteine desulfuration protein SufE
VSVAEKQLQLFETYSSFPDRQERLAAIVERGRRGVPFPSEKRIPCNRVPGCISAVWVSSELAAGLLFFAAEAEAPVVNGFVRLLCELYDGASPADIVTSEPTLLDELDLVRDLSPTRRNGLKAVRARLKEIALQQTAIP